MATLPAAASELLRPLFGGPPRDLEVVFAGSHALHLVTRDQRVPLLSVVPPDGVRLPGGLCCGEPDARGAQWSALRQAAGGVCSVGGGTLRIGPIDIRPVRWWDGSVLHPQAARPRHLAPAFLAGWDDAAVRPLDSSVRTPLERLAGALGVGREISPASGADVPVGDGAALEAAARALVGLGPGLTPSGDDVLVGLLLGLRSYAKVVAEPRLGHLAGAHRAVTAAALDAGTSTTVVSAALLTHAAWGEGMPVVLDLLRQLTAGLSGDSNAAVTTQSNPTDDLARAADRVAAVGHETGIALLHGIAVARRFALRRSPATISS